MYSDNDIRLYHSFKGTAWKNHKYISKNTSGGKTRYIYPGDRRGGTKEANEILKEAEAKRKDKSKFVSPKDQAFQEALGKYAHMSLNQIEEELWSRMKGDSIGSGDKLFDIFDAMSYSKTETNKLRDLSQLSVTNDSNRDKYTGRQEKTEVSKKPVDTSNIRSYYEKKRKKTPKWPTKD